MPERLIEMSKRQPRARRQQFRERRLSGPARPDNEDSLHLTCYVVKRWLFQGWRTATRPTTRIQFTFPDWSRTNSID